MKIQVGVMGSAGGAITDAELEVARRLGRRIAERDCTIVTGACPGLPHAAVLGAHEAGGLSLGVSPALSPEEHVNVYGSPLQPYTTMVFTGSGLMGRETHNIHSSDFVLFAGGRSGTLGEFCIAYDEGKLIGILRGSGGISNEFESIAALVHKNTGSTIVADSDPEKLVDRCLEIYSTTPIPSAKAFDRTAMQPSLPPHITRAKIERKPVAELTFIGAAGTVTGSKHLLTCNGKHILVDCGLFQGERDVVALNSAPLPLPPNEIDAVVITHGHIDHVGYLPKLVHDGFRGTIYATPATRALMGIVLEDAVHLQAHLHGRGMHQEHYAPPPFYNEADVQRTVQMTKAVPLDTPFDVAGMKAVYRNAAHIIGSAFVTFETHEGRIVFSGDMGRYNRALLYDPHAIGPADALICESTYGDRVHPPDALAALGETLAKGVARGGAIVIPAFAVERSQEILLSIGRLQRKDPRLANVRVFLDSPMAGKVDDLFRRFPDAHKPIPFDGDGTPFGCENLTVAVSTDESKAINHVDGPHIIISASGMAAGGRVLHHLYNHVPDPKATILFVGYQGAGTLGNLLVGGAQSIRIYGDMLPVHAAVGLISGYSAHADRDEIQQWFATCQGDPRFFAVHGDPVAAQALCDLVRTKYGWTARPASRGTTVTI